MKRVIAIVVTLVIFLSDAAVPITYAAAPLLNLLPKPEERPLETAISRLTEETTVTPEVLGLTDTNPSQSSAGKNLPVTLNPLAHDDFKASDEVTVVVNNPDKETLETKVVDTQGKPLAVEVHAVMTGTVTELQIDATDQFTPGKFTIEVSDTSGQTVKQDFTWGVLAINPDKSMYKPNEIANLSLAVLDDYGDMVCDAVVKLTVVSPDASKKFLSTGTGEIKVNPECHSKEFTLTPDYETSFQVAGPGEYKLKLEAVTRNGSYIIEDKILVKEEVAFDVKRTSATRIYPPLLYPMHLEITANEDFTGTITETVPESFVITPSEEANSYDKMNTLYLNANADPSAKLAKNVLGTTDGLVMPFDGEYRITQGFGTELTETTLRNFYSHYGLGGHDGVDFGVPTGTPLYAVDDGTVLLAGYGDYGITVIIDHGWGRSYYGHLSKVTVEKMTSVTKGSLIGYSGNTGESTGPHLHFGMKPTNPDDNNGYRGKIDPMPYLPIKGASVAQTFNLSNLKSVLAASHAAETNEASPSSSQSLSSESPIAPEPDVLAVQASSQPIADYTVHDDTIKKDVKYATSPRIEQVKVIKWHVSLKKGETTKLSYVYKTPQVSPQFYTVGPLRFYPQESASNPQSSVFEESRQWQIAADAVGVDWYNKAWQYRKAVTIDKDQVGSPNSSDAWCSDASGVTCNSSWTKRRKITFDNSASSTSLTNFPVLVVLNSSRIDYGDATPNDGRDIRFTDAGGTTAIEHEVESWNESGTSYVWVKVPSLAAGSSDYIWMYYGNDAASSPATELGSSAHATGVWNSNYTAVWHSNSSTASLPDSTSNGETGTKNGTSNPLSTSSGQVNGAQDYNGTSDRVQASVTVSAAGQTLEAWVRTDTVLGLHGILSTSGSCGGLVISDDNLQYLPNDGTNIQGAEVSGVISTATWYRVVGTYDGITMRLYLDGVEVAATGTGEVPPSGTSLELGHCPTDGGRYWNGMIDEARVSNTARSADWVEAEYISQTDAMNSFGSEQTSGSSVSLTNFPVLINLTTDSALAAKAQADGDDILFTDDTGRTQIPHEIESYNSGTGALTVWVRVSSLTSTSDTDIYMYYGNPVVTSQQDPTNVWSNGYVAVLHMDDSPTSATCSGGTKEACDSTSNANHGDATGTFTSDLVTGKIGNGISFDTDSNFVITDSVSLDSAVNELTVSVWANPTTFTAGQFRRVISRFNSLNAQLWFIEEDGTDLGTWLMDAGNQDNSGSTTVTSTGNWARLVMTTTSSTNDTRYYINSIIDGTDTGPGGVGSSTGANVGIGADPNNGTRFDGLIDEIHIANVVRSEGWILTEYNNENSPTTFSSLGSEETYPYAPTNAELMRHGKFFDGTGAEQPFAF